MIRGRREPVLCPIPPERERTCLAGAAFARGSSYVRLTIERLRPSLARRDARELHAATPAASPSSRRGSPLGGWAEIHDDVARLIARHRRRTVKNTSTYL